MAPPVLEDEEEEEDDVEDVEDDDDEVDVELEEELEEELDEDEDAPLLEALDDDDEDPSPGDPLEVHALMMAKDARNRTVKRVFMVGSRMRVP